MNSKQKHMLYSKLYRFLAPVLLVVLMSSGGCKKFLDQKPSIKQVVPHTLDDLQMLFNNNSMNQLTNSTYYAEIVADDYYMSDANWQSFSGDQIGQNYIWASSAIPYDLWKDPYQVINVANTVLDQLPKIQVDPKDSAYAKALKGSGLFYRSLAFWNLAQVYARPYATEYFSTPGVVLRLTSDASVPVRSRATVNETYDQIIADLKEAAALLPVNNGIQTRPSQTAAYALLARVYLSMRDYENAVYYANLALSQKNALLNYSQLPPAGFSALPSYSNPEMIFDNTPAPSGVLFLAFYERIDSSLYQSYSNDDLRKLRFFSSANGYYRFVGIYNNRPGNTFFWNGLATDELYLTRAECSARAGNKDSAMADLNKLLIARWNNTVPYPVLTASTAADALAKILVERRKELTHRGLRWTDIRRLNLEGANITLKRLILGTTYTLPPNDLRSVMLIPQTEIDLSGIQQNPR